MTAFDYVTAMDPDGLRRDYPIGEAFPGALRGISRDALRARQERDFQRILDYPALGFASEQPVPPAAMEAYLLLTAAGLTGQLR